MGEFTKIIEPKYGINDHLVSEAPTKEVLYSDRFFLAEICYAEYLGVWAWGCEYQYKGGGTGCGGGGSLPCFSHTRKEPVPVRTKEQCRKEALQHLEDIFSRRGDHPSKRSVEPVITAIKRAYNPQLSLF